jgi:hypothetical protein
MKKFNQRKPTQKELDAMDNFDRPLRPQPKPPAGGMGMRLEDENIEGYVSEAERRMMQGNMPEMKKGGKVKMHKMPGGKMMKDSDMKKKMMNKGGMVRGQGAAIRGTKFKGIF